MEFDFSAFFPLAWHTNTIELAWTPHGQVSLGQSNNVHASNREKIEEEEQKIRSPLNESIPTRIIKFEILLAFHDISFNYVVGNICILYFAVTPNLTKGI